MAAHETSWPREKLGQIACTQPAVAIPDSRSPAECAVGYSSKQKSVTRISNHKVVQGGTLFTSLRFKLKENTNQKTIENL